MELGFNKLISTLNALILFTHIRKSYKLKNMLSIAKEKYHIFQKTEFLTTITKISDLPLHNHLEIAFIGRSNAGKSSSINTLCHQNQLAFTSKKPGCTQNINYFTIQCHNKSTAYLVDLPGYGFANVPMNIKKKWQKLVHDYIKNREQLTGLILLVDARHSLTPLDKKILHFIIQTGKKIHILLTKSDKLTYQQQALALKKLQAMLNTLENLPNYLEKEINDFYQKKSKKSITISCQLFSSVQRTGLKEAQSKIIQWLQL